MECLELRRVGDGDSGAAVSLVLVAVGVGQVLVDANAELNKLVSNAVKLRLGTGDGLDGLEDLGGGVRSTGDNTSLVEEGEQINLTLELDGVVEVVVFVVDVGASSARAVLVELVRPETLLVIALQVGPDSLQSRDKISHVLSVEASTAVAGPSTVIVLGPETMDDPVVELVRS